MLEEKYTLEQILALCRAWGNSRIITLADTASIMGVDRETAKHVLSMGIQCHVLCRYHNSTWKVITKEVQSGILSALDNLIVDNKPRKSATDIMRAAMNQSHILESGPGPERIIETPINTPTVNEKKQPTVQKTPKKKSSKPMKSLAAFIVPTPNKKS